MARPWEQRSQIVEETLRETKRSQRRRSVVYLVRQKCQNGGSGKIIRIHSRFAGTLSPV
jgi:hypothetical protein